ncbi:MAG: hypothetical protein HKP08_09850 [Flavobacteriaceae bacterium]|nr:hypothetical protein [Flavobacteriaceae bacterium]
MKKVLQVFFVFLFFSCKSFRYDDHMIAFDYLNPENKEVRLSGDFDEIEFINGDKIYISCGYFRDWEVYPRSLKIIIVLKKKYAFQSYGSVTSSEYGTIPLTTVNNNQRNREMEDIRYIMSLAEIDMVERKNRILKDTIEIKLGEMSFRYVPRSLLRN